ncbi:MAG: TIGR03435 family protein [Acidobacteriota bacterium]|nr:TIGR03435 family protein [Acidobacteriota bacterium]
MDAYAAIYPAQVIGGPDWLNKDAYIIHGKIPDDLEAALQNMNTQDWHDETRKMAQSLLATRFHLQAHFETRILCVYELVPTKGGLKITAVPGPPEHKPGDPPPHFQSGGPLPPGTSKTRLNSNGLRELNAKAIQMRLLARIIAIDAGDRPIVDHTGFTGYFDVTALTWAPLGDATSSAPDAPGLQVALQNKLGIKLVPTKAPIEVLVIDQIGRPSPD